MLLGFSLSIVESRKTHEEGQGEANVNEAITVILPHSLISYGDQKLNKQGHFDWLKSFKYCLSHMVGSVPKGSRH
jgi:hypothetical protein